MEFRPLRAGDGTDTHGMRFASETPRELTWAKRFQRIRTSSRQAVLLELARVLSVSPTGQNFGTNYQVQFLRLVELLRGGERHWPRGRY